MYNRTIWKSWQTIIDADKLNNIESGIQALSDILSAIPEGKSLEDYYKLLKDFSHADIIRLNRLTDKLPKQYLFSSRGYYINILTGEKESLESLADTDDVVLLDAYGHNLKLREEENNE